MDSVHFQCIYHHQMDRLKSTRAMETSDGQEPLSLLGHVESNEAVILALELVQFIMVRAHCNTLQMDSCAPGN